MRHYPALLVSLSLVFTLILYSTLWAQPPRAARVKTITLTSTVAAPTKTFVGSVYFDRISQLSTEVSGSVAKVYFREGDTVNKGQTLVQLDTDFIVKEAGRIRALIELTEARLAHNEKDLNRYKQLLEQQATSATAYDKLFYSVAEIKAQKAAYVAELEATQLRLTKSIIRAPFTARILTKNVDVGNWITTGNTIARLGALSDIYVQVPISEKLLSFSHSGQLVKVWLPATDQHLTGLHRGFRPLVDAQTKNIYVRIKLDNISQPFENMSAEISLPVGHERTQLLVPRDALVTFNGKRFIYSIKEDKAAIVPIEVIGYSGDNAAISGEYLQQGMPVVVEGNERLRPDQPVTVVKD